MTPFFSQHVEHKLVTEFTAGGYKHTYGSPPKTETWSREEKLGEGTFGAVYKEICTETKAYRAVKEVKKRMARLNELDILVRLRPYPKYFVQLSGWFEDESMIYLAMEFLPGDLDSMMKERGISEDGTKLVTSQILAGIEIMHELHICHRDLKPSNILIARWIPLEVKIADFGISKRFDGTEGHTQTGTRPFMAPEVLFIGGCENPTYTTAVDIWSLGCLVYFMLTDSLPFPEERNVSDFVKGRSQSPWPEVGKNISDSAIEFMASLLRPLPEHRAPAKKARLHPWLVVEEQLATIWALPLGELRRTPARAAARPAVGAAHNSPPACADKLVPRSLRNKARTTASGAPKKALNYALVAAAENGNCELLEELLQKGARPTAEDNLGRTAMYSAAKSGHLSAIHLLLDSGAHIGVEGRKRLSPLHGAAEGGKPKVVHWLLEMGADMTDRQSDNMSAVQLAVRDGHLDVVKLLVDRGADTTEIAGIEGWTVLQLAVFEGHLEMTRFLLDRGADISSRKKNNGCTALHLATQVGFLEMINLLLDRGANISEKSDDGFSALHIAAQRGYLEVVTVLLDRGAILRDTSENGGYNALHLAAYSGHVDVVKLLLSRGFEISTKQSEGFNTLHLAAQQGQSEVVKVLIEEGANMSERAGIEGWTVLQLAAWKGHMDVTRFLLDRGADVSARKKKNLRTALQLAAKRGSSGVVRLLLDRGAIMWEKQNGGYNALHLAASSGHLEVVTILLDRGFEISQKQNEGFNALHLAAREGRLEVVNLLIDRGADISEQSVIGGWTVLQLAAWKGHLEVTRLLMDKGCDITAKKTNNGWTALHLAADQGHSEVVRLLLDRGASTTVSAKDGSTPISIAVGKEHRDIIHMLLDSKKNSSTPSSYQVNAAFPAAPAPDGTRTTNRTKRDTARFLKDIISNSRPASAGSGRAIRSSSNWLTSFNPPPTVYQTSPSMNLPTVQGRT